MDGVVTKPIDRAELALAINKVMGREIHVPVSAAAAPQDEDADKPSEDVEAQNLAAVSDFLSQIDGLNLDSAD